jgi:predicted cupin superfamily sugar epimerase
MSEDDQKAGRDGLAVSKKASGLSPEIRSLIDRLMLVPHPEGGWYRETWRSGVTLAKDALGPGYAGDRSAVTSILFLLPTGMRSRPHRVPSDEIWLHQQGDDLRLILGKDEGRALRLGQAEGALLQAVVPPGEWQEAEALAGAAGYALVGCVVAPGFDFEDFEMADPAEDDAEDE